MPSKAKRESLIAHILRRAIGAVVCFREGEHQRQTRPTTIPDCNDVGIVIECKRCGKELPRVSENAAGAMEAA